MLGSFFNQRIHVFVNIEMGEGGYGHIIQKKDVVNIDMGGEVMAISYNKTLA